MSPRAQLRRAALGFRAHTGWAVVVGLAGPAGSPSVVCRRRLDLAPGRLRPDLYHAARALDLDQAAGLVRAGTEAAAAAAERAVRDVVSELAAAGARAPVSAVLTGTVRMPTALQAILASHALLHAAEGALFREALMAASEASGMRVSAIPEREVRRLAGTALELAPEVLDERLGAMGRAAGPPWRQDEKLAALAAWTALAGEEFRRAG